MHVRTTVYQKASSTEFLTNQKVSHHSKFQSCLWSLIGRKFHRTGFLAYWRTKVRKLELLTCARAYNSLPESQCNGIFNRSKSISPFKISELLVIIDRLKIPSHWLSGRLTYKSTQVRSSLLYSAHMRYTHLVFVCTAASYQATPSGHSSLVDKLSLSDKWKKLSHPILLHFPFGLGTCVQHAKYQGGFTWLQESHFVKALDEKIISI